MLPQPRPILSRVKPYIPGRPIEEVVRELGLEGPVAKLASNENPLGTSPKAKEALRRYLGETFLYPDDDSFYLRRALAEKHGVAMDQIVLGCGSVDLIYVTALAYLEPGRSTVMAAGAFVMHKIAATIVNAELIEVPLRDHTHDLDAMRAAVKSDTSVIYIANPNNPTGTIVTKPALDKFIAAVPEPILVVIDEAYDEYITAPEYPESFDYLQAGRNVLILRTFSKIYGLAGLRLGYGFAKPEIIAALNKVRFPFNANRLAQFAATAALDDTNHIIRSRAVNEEGKEYLAREFDRLGLFYKPTYANFFFVDFGQPALPIFDALQRRGLITRPIGVYGFPNALRISIGTPVQNRRLVRALRALLCK